MARTAKIMQQMFAENSGITRIVLWDLFTSEDIEFLKKKIKILFPHNDVEIAVEELRYKIKKYNKERQEKRSLLLDIIWSQRLSSTTFVICTDDNAQLAKLQYSTECLPLIRIRKCFVENESENYYMIFVDENRRVYQHWEDYIENNTLPESILVIPKNGLENEVILEFFRIPACSPVRTAIQKTYEIDPQLLLTGLIIPVSLPLIAATIERSKTFKLFYRGKQVNTINSTNLQATTPSLAYTNLYNTFLGFTGSFGTSSNTPFIFTAEDIEILKNQIKFLFPDYDGKTDEEKLRKDITKYNKQMQEKRSLLMESVWNQRKYSNGDLLTATIFIMWTPNTDDSVQLARSQYATEFSCHPLIRIRKCFVGNESENCCMIFVDENGRVYQNWKDYIENNTLPEGVLVVPKNGIYDFTEDNEVILEFFRTPACSTGLQIADNIIGAAGIATAVCGLAAIVCPIAAPVLIGAEVVGCAAGLWSAGRSIGNLVDREQHEESIDVTNPQARSSWIGIGGGILGVGGIGASRGLTRYAASGKNVSSLVKGTINGINIASVAVNGVGIGNGIVELILKARDDEDVNALDVLQLGASLILFTHSIYNFQYAHHIIRKAHEGKINDFKKTLSNKQRKMFNRMYKETIKIKGQTAGKLDVVRSIANIPDNQLFNDLYKIRGALDAGNLRPAFSSDGNVLLNNDVPVVDSAALRYDVQHGQGEIFFQNIQDIPQHIFTGYENLHQPRELSLPAKLTIRVTTLVRYTLKKFVVINKAKLKNCFEHLHETLSDEAVNVLTEIAEKFVSTFLDEIHSRLHRVIPFEQVLWDLFQLCDRIHGSTGSIDENWLREHSKILLSELKKFYEKQIRKPIGRVIKCSSCNGFYRNMDAFSAEDTVIHLMKILHDNKNVL